MKKNTNFKENCNTTKKEDLLDGLTAVILIAVIVSAIIFWLSGLPTS